MRVRPPREHCHQWHQRVGSELGQQFGYRAQRLDGRFRQGDHTLLVPPHRTDVHCNRRQSCLGGRLGWKLGHRAQRFHRRPCQGVSHSSYGFSNPGPIAAEGNKVWVLNENGAGSVTELDAMTGGLIRTISGPSYKFSNPTGIAADRNHVWVANSGGRSVTEISTATGQLV